MAFRCVAGSRVLLFVGLARVKCASVHVGSLFDWFMFDNITLNSTTQLSPVIPEIESLYLLPSDSLLQGQNSLVLSLRNILREHKHVCIVYILVIIDGFIVP